MFLSCLLDQISSCKGQSGAGIITGLGKNIVVGIHLAGPKDQNQDYNLGLHLNISMITRLQIWREQLNGDEFTVWDMQTNQRVDTNACFFKQIKNMYKEHEIKYNKLKKQSQKQLLIKQQEYQRMQDKLKKYGGINNLNPLKMIEDNQALSQLLIDRQNNLRNQQKTIHRLKSKINQKAAENYELKKKHCQLALEKEQLGAKIIAIKDKAQFIWNPYCQDANKFLIDQRKITLITLPNSQFFSIRNSKPLPRDKITTLKMRLLKYGGQKEISFGFTTRPKQAQYLGTTDQKDISYCTSTMKGGVGWIQQSSLIIREQSTNFFLPQDSVIEIMMDIKNSFVSCCNLKTQERLRIQYTYDRNHEDCYLFCRMGNQYDCIEIIDCKFQQ